MSFNVSLTSRSWASEISWTLGGCSSKTVFENRKTHEGECSLPSGQYTLVCKDSYGDGWHGGFIMISGKTYCESFDSGFSETHEVMIGSDTKRHGNLKRLYKRVALRNLFDIHSCTKSYKDEN